MIKSANFDARIVELNQRLDAMSSSPKKLSRSSIASQLAGPKATTDDIVKIQEEHIQALTEQRNAATLKVQEDIESFKTVNMKLEAAVAMKKAYIQYVMQEAGIQVPTQQVPAQQVPTQQVPAQQVPTQQMPTQQVPAQQVPSLQMPTPQMPTQLMPTPQAIGTQQQAFAAQQQAFAAQQQQAFAAQQQQAFAAQQQNFASQGTYGVPSQQPFNLNDML